MASLFFSPSERASGNVRLLPRVLAGAALLFVAAGAIVVAWRQPYTPASDLGYALGLVGGLMMAALLAYPLRKHFRPLRRAGPMKPWFQAHMVLGVLGPVLVIFHTGFRFSSMNAIVAFTCMVVVAGSGFIGRYAYRRIHHGLYGRRASLAELDEALQNSERGLASLLRAAPVARDRLDAFRIAAFDPDLGAARRVVRFLTLGWRSRALARQLDADIALALREHGPKREWDDREQARRARRGSVLVRDYLRSVQSNAQFTAFERIFSWWHVLHIPLVYLLVASACYHVLAVHMY